MIDLINKRINELENIAIDTTLVDYLNGYRANISAMIKYDFFDILVLFNIVINDISLSDSKKEVEKIHDILEVVISQSKDEEFIFKLIDTFNEFIELCKIDKINIEEFLKVKSNKNKVVSLIKRTVKNLSKSFKEDEVNTFLKWMCIKEKSDIITFSSNLKMINKELDSVYDELDEYEIPDYFSGRDTKKVQTRFVKKVNGAYLNKMSKEFTQELNKLSSYQNKKNSEISSIKKKINREIKELNLLKQDYLNKSLTLDKIEKYKIPDNIRLSAIIELIKTKNEKYTNVSQKLEEYHKNPINQLEIIFEKNGYDFNKLTLKERDLLANQINNESIEEKLNFISNSSLKFITGVDECFISILMQNIEDLMQLDSLFIRKKIDADFILKYGVYFNSLKIRNMSYNISKLDNKKIDFNKLNEYNSNILFDLDTKLFDLLVKYDINLSDNNIKHYEFLEDNKLVNIIDKFIEMGLYEQIKNSPNLIKTSSLKILKRINLLNQLGEDVINDNLTIKQNARNGENFYLSDDYLDDYLNLNYQNYMSKDILEILNSNDNLCMIDEFPDSISFIENYKKDEQTYMIGGLYFSRLKVKRCLNTLIEYGYTNYKEILIEVLIYNYPYYISPNIIENLQNLDKQIIRKQLTN